MTQEITEKQLVLLEKLRRPFDTDQISKLPKPTRAQTEEVKRNYQMGIRCNECGAWHHPKVVHLDYVGHAALTNRLLEVDLAWNWEPVSDGLQSVEGGMWIKLTVCGITRLGFGDAGGKQGGDAMKERIGDALRNAAMRFGCALDLWHKGESIFTEDDTQKDCDTPSYTLEMKQLKACGSISSLSEAWEKLSPDAKTNLENVKDECKKTIQNAETDIPQ